MLDSRRKLTTRTSTPSRWHRMTNCWQQALRTKLRRLGILSILSSRYFCFFVEILVSDFVSIFPVMESLGPQLDGCVPWSQERNLVCAILYGWSGKTLLPACYMKSNWFLIYSVLYSRYKLLCQLFFASFAVLGNRLSRWHYKDLGTFRLQLCQGNMIIRYVTIRLAARENSSLE